MFNLSDRDTKLILGMFIVCIIVLPYVFYSKDTKADTEIQQAKNVQLQQRYDELQRMNEHREEYIAETKRLDAKRDEIIASFPADIRAENTTMMLHNMEQDSIILRDKNMDEIAEDGLPEDMDLAMYGIYGNTLLWFDTTGYGKNDIIPISEEDTPESIKGVVNMSALTFKCFYDGLKWMLQEVMDQDDPMIYRTIEAEYDDTTGQLEGTMGLEQYAIMGPGRELGSVQITPDNYGHEIERSNLPYGIFGGLEMESAFERRSLLLQQMMMMEEVGLDLDMTNIAPDMSGDTGNGEAAPAAE